MGEVNRRRRATRSTYAMYVKRPTAAPFAADGVPGIKQAKVRTIERHWPTVPHRKSLRLPTLSIRNHDNVAKIE
jgi:hypothetical protein